MLNCIAVDDEDLALALVEDNIKKVPYLNLVAKCNDAFEATKALQDFTVDLVFIDIQMPGLTGLQFIESLQVKPMVILITAYKQFALEGYTLDVVDYLVKPVPMDRFLKACNKAKTLFEMKEGNRKNANSNTEVDFFFVNVDYTLIKVQFDDVSWVEGLRDYVKIHLKSTNKPILTRNSVSGIEKLLPPAKFVRIHKSFILSVSSITAIRKNSIFIGAQEFPVGETYRDVVTNLIGMAGK